MNDEYDLLVLSAAPLGDVPWYFRLGRFLSRHKIRGGDRLLSALRRHGLLDRLVEYRVSRDVRLRVPLWRPCNQWLPTDVQNYEAAFMRALCTAIRQLHQPVTFVDCGADIGTVSAHVVARCPNISRIIAFEPNLAAFHVLAANLRTLGVPAEARCVAVGDFNGRGRLVSPSHDPSAHAMYVERTEDGPIEIEQVDALDLAAGRPTVIKIDVEGSEPEVVRGAQNTIRNAGDVIVAFEAHPKVAMRTATDPLGIVEELRRLRPDFVFEVDTSPPTPLRTDVPFFDQFPPTRVYNIVARSIAR
ncbi:MAG: FkbM family methyltransferase [Kofleriaceae bacterium]|nr:FkbM family methyltransferase [Kofleriaceae bacterium]